MAEHEFIIFYTMFILFVIYLSGLIGFSILQGTESIPTSTNFSFDFLQAFGIFSTLLLTGVVPEFQVIFGIILVPYIMGILYILWKALPFT